MANFPTHIAVGTVVSGALATVTVAAELVAPENVVAVTLAGVLGSVLPDIDLKDSRPGRAMFSGLAVFFSFAVLFSLERKYSIAEMLILWLGTLVAVRYLVYALFNRFSYHRGVWHSIVAAIFCACVTAIVYTNLLGRNEGVAWLAGGFMFMGYLTHLVLDEIYSVDVMDTRIKSSFGTAVKLVDLRHPRASVAMVAAMLLAFYLAPPMQLFLEGMTTQGLWSSLHHRLLPQGGWFGVDWSRAASRLPDMPFRARGQIGPAVANTVTTGSIGSEPSAASRAPTEKPAGQ
jgi:LexA-binding, inner membrane-associated putative hydrolase